MPRYMTAEHGREGECTSEPDSSKERTHVPSSRAGVPLRVERKILRTWSDTMTKAEYDAWHMEVYGR